MNNYITYVSWEDRFLESLKHDILEFSPNHVSLYYSLESKDRIVTNMKETIEFLNKMGISYSCFELVFEEQLTSWKILKRIFIEELIDLTDFIVNISTMPRNMIYLILNFLNIHSKKFKTIYYNAKTHGNELTKNPSIPQLVLQHSGITDSDKKTLLVVLLGYDTTRVYQLYHYFEPEKIFICIEEKDKTEIENIDNIKKDREYNDIPNKNLLGINSYNNTLQEFLMTKIKPYISSHNIIVCSLGPKLSALELFKFNLSNPEVSIAFSQSKDYSDNYSKGVDLDEPFITDWSN